MDDYEPWLTPCDPDFDPEKCESAYALWAVKEEGEPVKFLEASITDNLDYPSGYWFFWRTISFSEETGRLIEGEWGGAGDICRADYVADMVLPGGAVFARVQGELDDGIPFDWEVRRPLDDCAKTRAAEAIRAGILALPLSASASIEAIPSPYKIDVSIVHGGTLTHDMARNLLVSAEHYYRDSALCGLLEDVYKRQLKVRTMMATPTTHIPQARTRDITSSRRPVGTGSWMWPGTGSRRVFVTVRAPAPAVR